MGSNAHFYPIDRSRLANYRSDRLFVKTGEDSFDLYKLAGKKVDVQDALTLDLYIHIADKVKLLRSKQVEFNTRLSSYMDERNYDKIRTEFTGLVNESVLFPDRETFDNFNDTLGIFVDKSINNVFPLETLFEFSSRDFATGIHSINVMAFTVDYLIRDGFRREDISQISLGALFHDLGKFQVDMNILQKPGALTDEEFSEIKKHPLGGYNILKRMGYSESICQIALEHHEKIDGSGYPRGIGDIPYMSQVVGVIDCYEALISNTRFYKSGMSSYEAQKIIQSEISRGKFNKNIFSNLMKTRLNIK